jgi:hypothetical protein
LALALCVAPVPPVFPDNQKVQQRDAQEFSRILKTLQNPPIFVAGFDPAAGVVVKNDDVDRTIQDGPLENLSRADQRTISRADRNYLFSDQSVAAIKVQADQVFPVPAVQMAVLFGHFHR